MIPDGLNINPNLVKPIDISQPAAVERQPVETPQPEVREEPAVQDKTILNIDTDALEKIAEEFNENFQMFNAKIQFSVDKTTGNTVVKIYDKDTEEVIREIPPKELVNLAAKLSDLIGRLVDHTV